MNNNISYPKLNNSITFTAKISDKVQTQISRQAKEILHKKTTKQKLMTQMENVAQWGADNSEIIICKNVKGKFRLGLKVVINKYVTGIWAFENLKGRTELSQFMNLTSSHITSCEDSIKYLFNKYGFDIFKKAAL